ncbi:MAG: helix-turn-helix transcriptional regulator [Colwellia sp.]|nr:helix-turn-helix transcriptional regulator [Colwellia sp.]
MNKLFFHPHCIFYIGESFDTVLHSHLSVQICVGLEGNIKLIAQNNSQLITQSAIIPSNFVHQLDASETLIAILFIDVHSKFFKQLKLACRHLDFNHFVPLLLPQDLLASLAALGQVEGSHDVSQIIDDFIDKVTLHGSCQPVIDRRVLQTLQRIDKNKTSQIPIEILARMVNLSTSRLAHLFKAQMGIPIRRYSLWRRLRHAIEHAYTQQSLTEGAHYAGFADSAHLSRVFKAMYGINPSQIVSAKTPVNLFFL